MDLIDFSRYFAALLIVLGLLGGFAVILRQGWLPRSLGGWRVPTGRPVERRLTVSESLILDPRRRVVIVRADDQDHVVLLGAERETVLDTRPAMVEPAADPVVTPLAEFKPIPPEPQDAPPDARAEGGRK